MSHFLRRIGPLVSRPAEEFWKRFQTRRHGKQRIRCYNRTLFELCTRQKQAYACAAEPAGDREVLLSPCRDSPGFRRWPAGVVRMFFERHGASHFANGDMPAPHGMAQSIGSQPQKRFGDRKAPVASTAEVRAMIIQTFPRAQAKIIISGITTPPPYGGLSGLPLRKHTRSVSRQLAFARSERGARTSGCQKQRHSA